MSHGMVNIHGEIRISFLTYGNHNWDPPILWVYLRNPQKAVGPKAFGRITARVEKPDVEQVRLALQYDQYFRFFSMPANR